MAHTDEDAAIPPTRAVGERAPAPALETEAEASRTLGVGMLGAGPVVQAIHLPTLARLSDRFAVTHIMDVSPDVASATAVRVGAAWSTSLDELLADPAVDVVAVCSPSQFHADQVIAACRAGKRAVLCEKPFATNREEAERIAAVSAETGVPIIVGAMHTFDPGWTTIAPELERLEAEAHTIRSSIVLPPNPRFEDFATEVENRVPMAPPSGPITPEVSAARVHGGVLGLAIHDLPLVRRFVGPAPDIDVRSAEFLAPFGYLITASVGGRALELLGAMHQGWHPRWEFEAIGDDLALHVDFTPSYVHGGSAVATLHRADGTSISTGPFAHNGYEGEWRAIHEVVSGNRDAAPRLEDLIDDLTFAVDLAEASATSIRGTEQPA